MWLVRTRNIEQNIQQWLTAELNQSSPVQCKVFMLPRTGATLCRGKICEGLANGLRQAGTNAKERLTMCI